MIFKGEIYYFDYNNQIIFMNRKRCHEDIEDSFDEDMDRKVDQLFEDVQWLKEQLHVVVDVLRKVYSELSSEEPRKSGPQSRT